MAPYSAAHAPGMSLASRQSPAQMLDKLRWEGVGKEEEALRTSPKRAVADQPSRCAAMPSGAASSRTFM